MTQVIQAAWTPRLVFEMVPGIGLIVAFMFSLTAIGVGGYYLMRVVRGSLGGLSGSASRERAEGADQARRLALMALICGPAFTLAMGLFMLPVVILTEGVRVGAVEFLGALLLVLGIGLVAGLIAAGSFLITARVLGPVRKQIRKWRRGKAWDPDFDGIA